MNRLCNDLVLDIDHIKVSLDWTPVVSTVEGIKLCVPNTITRNQHQV